jgi:hypothetical protein
LSDADHNSPEFSHEISTLWPELGLREIPRKSRQRRWKAQLGIPRLDGPRLQAPRDEVLRVLLAPLGLLAPSPTHPTGALRAHPLPSPYPRVRLEPSPADRARPLALKRHRADRAAHDRHLARHHPVGRELLTITSSLAG